MEMKITRASTIFCLGLLAGIQAIVGILIEKPENTVVMVNENATLKCKSDKQPKELLRWHLSMDAIEDPLWNGYAINQPKCPCPCCQIDDMNSRKFNLNITARKETATHYKCTEPGSEQSASASLIVMESKMSSACALTKTSSGSTLSCVIGFYGKWIPKIEWSRDDGKQVNESDVTVSNDNGKLTITITTPLRLCKARDANPHAIDTTAPTQSPDQVFFTASVYFSETNRPTEVTATNIPIVPADAAEWKSPALCNYPREAFPKWAVAVLVTLGCAAVLGLAAGVIHICRSSKSSQFV